MDIEGKKYAIRIIVIKLQKSLLEHKLRTQKYSSVEEKKVFTHAKVVPKATTKSVITFLRKILSKVKLSKPILIIIHL